MKLALLPQQRLDALASEEARVQIMESCGVNCARRNSGVTERGWPNILIRRDFGQLGR